MPMRRNVFLSLVVLLPVALAGCSGPDRNWKETIPVSGIVMVDGEAAEGVMINFHPSGGMDTEQPTETKGLSSKDGSFKASTYEMGDGAPEGQYQVTFAWPKLDKISMSFSGDKLKGRYSKPAKSEFKIDVVSGQPVDMGTIELKSK